MIDQAGVQVAGQITKASPPMPGAFQIVDELNMQLGGLTEEVAALEVRLAPVSRQRPDAVHADKENLGATTELNRRLCEAMTSVLRLRSRITYAVSALELGDPETF